MLRVAMREPDEVETAYELAKDFFAPLALLFASVAIGLFDSLREEQNLYSNLGALIGGAVAVVRVAWLWMQLSKKREEIKANKRRYEELNKAYEKQRVKFRNIEKRMDEILDPTSEEQSDSVLNRRDVKKPEE